MDEKLKIEIGQRLRDFAVKNFETIEAFAQAIDIPASSLRSIYFKGKSSPGAAILIKLLKLNCDINWLLTGATQNKTIEKLQEENNELRQVNYTLLDQATKFSKVAAAVEGHNRLKHKKKG